MCRAPSERKKKKRAPLSRDGPPARPPVDPAPGRGQAGAKSWPSGVGGKPRACPPPHLGPSLSPCTSCFFFFCHSRPRLALTCQRHLGRRHPFQDGINAYVQQVQPGKLGIGRGMEEPALEGLWRRGGGAAGVGCGRNCDVVLCQWGFFRAFLTPQAPSSHPPGAASAPPFRPPPSPQVRLRPGLPS